MSKNFQIEDDKKQEDGTHIYWGRFGDKRFKSFVGDGTCVVKGDFGEILKIEEQKDIRKRIEDIHTKNKENNEDRESIEF